MSARLEFCLSFVDTETYEFNSLDNRIYIDEKWFYTTETDRTIYMAPHETPPHRTVQSKRFITKVMFVAAVMRPIYGADGSMVFDGKIGMWPFVERVSALKSSRNRAAGTLVTHSVNVGRKEQIPMLVDDVIPAIKSKCPSTLRGTELISKQDGARCHVSPHDPVIRAACKEGGWNITLDVQSPNSLDLNTLDLGYFCSIQALQYEECPRNIDELIDCTIASFTNLKDSALKDTFVSLQKVMECVIQDRGNHSYTQPHIGKAKLRKAGLLGRNYVCNSTVYLEGAAYHLLASHVIDEKEKLLRLQVEAFKILTSQEKNDS